MNLDGILKNVIKPARYIGNEYNSIHKDLGSINIHYALAFPDIYEVGMSHLGSKILYHHLNNREDTYCERVFAPWVDMEAEMRKHHIPLFSLESRTPLSQFDFIGFTLQYEMSYTNILNMLSLGGIPLLSKDRTREHPFIMAGGPCGYNPEPLADFIDFFVLGEGEEIILNILDIYKKWESTDKGREDLLQELANLDGIYVPSFYNISFSESGELSEITPKKDGIPVKIKKVIVEDMDNIYFPTKPIVPYIETVHERVVLELFRGCTRGCRFCQAGMIYRPIREKTIDKLVEHAKESIKETGYDEISLSSLSTNDYKELNKLVDLLIEELGPDGVSMSLPSLRLDTFSIDLAQKVQQIRKSGLTFAPEAGSQRLRDVINKGVTQEDLEKAVIHAFQLGWSTIKLYFMIGLPTETMDDIEEIAKLAYRVLEIYREKGKKGRFPRITVSTSSFVPKAFTPFQWERQFSSEELTERQKYLKDRLRNKAISYNWHDTKLSFLEGVFSRGDRRLCRVLLKAHELGCSFDGWSDIFNYENWIKAFEATGVNPEIFNLRERSLNEVLPWDHIDVGVSKEYLKRERNRAYNGELTPDCRTNCTGCGINILGGIC